MNVSEEKKIIRRDLLNSKLEMTEDEWLQKSRQAIKNLVQLEEIQDSDRIHCYVSMNKRHELNTLEFIEQMLDEGKEIVIPVIAEDNLSLHHSFINGIGDLQKNNWGVLEPKRIIPADIETVDLIVVPMVGADKERNRIGYGKGFYDRFLEGVSQKKVGLCFSNAIVDELPTEPFDIKLDIIVTDSEIIQ